jgi:hypothetical protein
MKYEAIQDESFKDTWRVEAIDHESEMVIYVAVFTGPDAGARAQAYVEWQNLGSPPPIA